MSSRVGIEISRAACRVVELDRAGSDAATMVRSYAHAAAPDAASLSGFRRRACAVVVWGLRAHHRQATVTAGSYQRMRREAAAAARSAGIDTRHMLADIAPAGPHDDPARRTVVLALAPTSDVAAALRTVLAAGVKAHSIVTPALALMSLARLRRSATTAGTVEAYVAFEETCTAIALIRDAALVASRELDWGFQGVTGLRSREDAAKCLADAIRAFFDDCGVRRDAVSQVCVCGGMPEMRNMTLSLMERLDVEVEPLDSLFGVDADHLPEPADDFRERVVDLRLAWAVAADWNAPLDFLRERRRRTAKTALTRAAVIAGVATGVAGAWRVERGWLSQEDTAPPPRAASAVKTARPAISIEQPPVAQAVIPIPPLQPPPQQPRAAQSMPTPPRSASSGQPELQQPARTLVLTPVSPAVVETPRPVQPAVRAPIAEPRPLAPAPRGRTDDAAPLRFEGSLGTILYGSDRKVAIVDGRIVQIGDDIRGAHVVDITPDAVLFRDAQGRLRKLTLQDSRR